MKIIVASSGHKDFLNPKDSSEIISNIIEKCHNLESVVIPVTDGGEGLIDILVEYFKGQIIQFHVHDSLFRIRKAKIGLIKNKKTAVIEIAEAAGSSLLKNHEKQTMVATSYGVGEMIKKCYDIGCREFYIGLGGSIVSDCGLGLAQALGIEFFGRDNKILEPIVGRGFNALSLPLVYKYSCQKINIDLNEIDFLEKGYKNISDIIFKLTETNIDIPYAGAGGGMGAGLLGFLGAELIPGAKFVSEQINFCSEMEKADILIVSEGKLDESTLSNKAPFYFSNLAKKLNKKVICIVGKQDIKLEIFDKVYAPDNKHIKLQKSKIIQNLQSQTMNFLDDIQNGVFNEKN